MGQRSSTETVARVFVNFLKRRIWTQAELAREVGVESRALATILREIQKEDPRLEREDDPPNVLWRAPRDWVPTGAVIETGLLRRIERLLGRLPVTPERETVLKVLKELRLPTEAVPMTKDGHGGDVLTTFEDGQARRVAVRIKYFSTHRGDFGERHVSVHQIRYDERPRIVAMCHRDRKLKWFRVDGTLHATLDPAEPYRAVAESTVREFAETSLQGFHAEQPVETYTCVVKDPNARWILRNLPAGLTCDRTPGGTRITARTTALEMLARFVVSYGGLVEAESAVLRAKVRALAETALAVHADAGPTGDLQVSSGDPALSVPNG